MLKLAYALAFTIALFSGAGPATAVPMEYADDVAQANGVSTPRKKRLGDVSYRTMWRMQARVSGMLPENAHMIAPVLRLSVAGMNELERSEFQPESWAVAIVGKTVDALVPMRRGGYFELPALPHAQARSEDAVVMFNSGNRTDRFVVGWHVNVPASGTFAYMQFGQALAELKGAQDAMPWWDIVAIPDKNARFDAIRACFSSDQGRILLDGKPVGQKLGRHCSLLAFDPLQLSANPAIAFSDGLDFVTLDNSANYPIASVANH